MTFQTHFFFLERLVKAMVYFQKFHQLKEYYKSLQEFTSEKPIGRAQGRLDSPIVFILPDYSSPFSIALIRFLKKWFERRAKELKNIKFHQICSLSYIKGNSIEFSNEVLSNELRIIQPKIICSTVPLRINGESVLLITSIPKHLFKSCNSKEIETFFEDDGIRLEQELNQLFPIISNHFS